MTASGNAERFAARPLSGGGTPTHAWRGWGRPFPELDLTGCRAMLLVAPHPDDETLGFGASAATLQARDIKVQVVSVSDGDASNPRPSAAQRSELAEMRRTELRGATEILGLSPPIHLGLPDGELAKHTLELADRLTELLDGVPGTWLAATWRGDGHPDHEAVGRAAATVADSVGVPLVEYPVWMWHWASPNDAAVPWQRAARIAPDRTAVNRKQRAAGVFRTQLEPHGCDAAVLPPFVLQRLLAVTELVFT